MNNEGEKKKKTQTTIAPGMVKHTEPNPLSEILTSGTAAQNQK